MGIQRSSSRTSANASALAAASKTSNVVLIAPASVTSTAADFSGNTGTSQLSGVLISQIQVTNSDYIVLDDQAINISGGYIKIIGSGFKSGCIVYAGGTAAISTTFISSTEVRAQLGASTSNALHVYLVNTDNSSAVYLTGIIYSGTPIWVTDSTIPSQVVDYDFSINLAATSDSSVTYAVSAGSNLPAGILLSSTGILSGIVVGLLNNTTYSFSIDAIDLELQDTARTFSLTITVGERYFTSTNFILKNTDVNLGNNKTFIDSSVNAATITVGNNVAQGSVSPYPNDAGIVYSPIVNGGSANFDGVGDYLSVASTTNNIIGTSAFTIEAWVYITKLGVVQSIINKGAATTGWALQINASNNLQFVDAATLYTYSGTAIPINTWTHIAVTRTSANSLYLFINGVRSALLGTVATNFSLTTIIYIGCARASLTTLNFNGFISDLRFVKGSTVYENNFTPPVEPLTAITNTQLLLNCNNASIYDATAKNDLETFGSVVSSTAVTKFATASTYFPGTSYIRVAPKDDYSFGTGDFTIEYWVNTEIAVETAGNFNLSILGQSTAYGIFVRASIASNCWILYVGDPATTSWVISSANVGSTITYPTVGVWQHHALTRSAGTLRFFINGIQTYSIANSTNLTQKYLYLGVYASLYLKGYLEDFRVTKGIGRYTSDFTPPQQAFPSK